MKRIYLDYNSTTPLMENAKKALLSALECFGNPSSVHAEGRQAKAIMQQARRDIAALICADPENLVFTSGATEAAMMLLTPHYFLGRAPLFMSQLYFSATEHPCITGLGRFAPQMSTCIPVDSNGLVQPETLRTMLAGHDKSKGLPLVAVQYANHETGVIQPVDTLADIIRQAGGVFIVDTVQAAGKEKLDITKGCGDFFILSAHKIGGPKGVGACVGSGSILRPATLLTGGGQERGLRGGTEALPLIAAFGAAAADAGKNLHEQARLAQLHRQLEEGLRNISPDITIHGSGVRRLSNTSFFSVPGIKAETLQIAFDLEGIAVSAGAACSSAKVGASPVLQAMGIKDPVGAIRVSTGQGTQEDDIGRLLKVFKSISSRKNNRPDT